ncbi:MAG: hypothetical protein AAF253_00185 [Pseudomonadota bacterium]
MAQTALLTLGRLPKGLDIARALQTAGWRVVVADPFKRHLCSSSNAVDRCHQVTAPVADADQYTADLLAIIEAESISLVVPISEEAMFAAALKDRMPEGVRFFGPDLDTIRALHDKAAFIETAAALGLAVPETHRLGTPAAEQLAARSDVIVKRVFSSAGIGVETVAQGAPLPPTSSAPALVQARLTGRHRSSVSLAFEGRPLGHVFYEGTVFSETVAVAFRRIDAPDLEDWCEPFIRETRHTGFIAFDFIDDETGRAHAIECNPRANSGVHFFDPTALGEALADPETAPMITHRPARLMQQFLPCLTEAQANVFNAQKRRNHWHYLTRSKDVTWSAADPWPLVMMTPNSWAILKRSIFQGETFGEAAVADIAYLGPDQPG